VNRVGDVYLDQLESNGHARRLADLERLAELGVRTVRYPVLWERTARERDGTLDWSWADERLARLRDLGLRPIVGLVHHGSGPSHTSLLDPGFADGLARYARALAERHPWLRDFTPVNEPLTTARFSALYGHWYPHRRDTASFVRALLNQCRGTALAMRAIREVVPDARLVQTEDVGRTSSSARLGYQAVYENQRRLLSLDLLCGLVTRDHPLWRHLVQHGATPAELDAFRHAPCPPDVIAVNYYLTSDRHLDDDLARYPAWTHGGNGRDRYADVERVRTGGAIAGHRAILGELWRRFGIPVAIGEVHLGGTREEQIRWLLESWRGAVAARDDGADVRAVTLWATFGSFDWDSLVVRRAGSYESGAFDVRSDPPRPTALARVASALARGESASHPAAHGPGWWRRPMRVLYGEPSAPLAAPEPDLREPILVTGATGTLGRAFARVCELRGLAHRVVGRSEMDIANPASVAVALRRFRPWAVVNAAGYVRVDAAEQDAERCRRENHLGPVVLAAACAEAGIPLVTFSSDLVFDGQQREPYVESDPTAPLCVYGRTKADAEREVLARLPSALVVRTSAFFGPWDEYNFVTIALRTLASGRSFRAAVDSVVSPTYVPDLVNATLDLLIDGESGVWHLANAGAVTWAELARRSAELARIDATPLVACSFEALGLPAERPAYSVLGSERGVLLPPLERSLARYAAELSDRGW